MAKLDSAVDDNPDNIESAKRAKRLIFILMGIFIALPLLAFLASLD